MIDKQQFENLVRNPGKLSLATIPQLEALLEKFPYCQTAHLLYLRNLKVSHNINFKQQLRITAAYAADRAVLRKQIEIPGDVQRTPSTEEKAKTTTSRGVADVHPKQSATLDEEADQSAEEITPTEPEQRGYNTNFTPEQERRKDAEPARTNEEEAPPHDKSSEQGTLTNAIHHAPEDAEQVENVGYPYSEEEDEPKMEERLQSDRKSKRSKQIEQLRKELEELRAEKEKMEGIIN